MERRFSEILESVCSVEYGRTVGGRKAHTSIFGKWSRPMEEEEGGGERMRGGESPVGSDVPIAANVHRAIGRARARARFLHSHARIAHCTEKVIRGETHGEKVKIDTSLARSAKTCNGR